MANNITNRITFSWDPNDGGTGDDIDEIRSKYSLHWHPLDLEKVLPEPEEVLLDKFVLDAYNISVKNTYRCDEPNAENPRDDEIWCYSAWSPISVFAMTCLSKKYPTVEIMHEYADEDYGHRCGYRRYKGGKLVGGFDLPDYSKKAYEFFSTLTGRDLYADCGMKYDPETETYQPCEEEES